MNAPLSLARRLTAAAVAVAFALVLGGCAGATAPVSSPAPSAPVTPAATAVPSPGPPGLAFTPLPAQPAQRPQAELDVAFDAVEAGALLSAAPDGIDFATSALLCVYLGERTGSWQLTLVSAALEGGELRVRAREAPPRGSTGTSRATYPAACGTLDRRALPAGNLAARADDTVSGEFIVAATITVPGP